ncbi:hypothetical protein D3C77_374640 [compost metagenome]
MIGRQLQLIRQLIQCGLPEFKLTRIETAGIVLSAKQLHLPKHIVRILHGQRRP